MAFKMARIAALALGLAAGTSAQAADYLYTLGGFSGGGTATLSFSATERHGDGALDWYGLAGSGDGRNDFFESLSLDFSGDSAVAPFSMGLMDIVRLHLDATTLSVAGTSQSLEMEGGRTVFSSYSYVYGDGTAVGSAMAMQLDGLQVNVSTSAQSLPAAAAPVPEPESWALLLAGLGAVGFVARRRA